MVSQTLNWFSAIHDTGVTSAAVPVKKQPTKFGSSVGLIFLSWTFIFLDFAIPITVLQMVSIGLLLSGETGNKIINFQDYNAQTIGIILLWLSAFLTLYTGYEYVRKGIDHAISEDNKN